MKNAPECLQPLTGRSVLVVEAAGPIGEAVTRVLLREGARVVAAGREGSSLSRLAGRVGGPLVTEVVPVGDADRASVTERLAAHGPFDGVVFDTGRRSTCRGTSLLDVSEALWRETVEPHLSGFFHGLLTLVPLLSPRGTLVCLGGSELGGGARPGLAGAVQAARSALVDSLTQELRSSGQQVYELIPVPGLASSARWEEAGRHAARLIAGASPDVRLDAGTFNSTVWSWMRYPARTVLS